MCRQCSQLELTGSLSIVAMFCGAGLANSTSPDQLICFVVETFGIDHDIDNP